MSGPPVIAGSASMIGRSFDTGVETAVRAVVSSALVRANIAMDDIDTVVSVASDTLDGVMIPIRAEIAGSFGKSYINVPSSAGHALGASLALLESRQAENLLLVGWGSAARLSESDPRSIQADPFYDRPVGASPAALSALQACELEALGFAGSTRNAAGQQANMSRRAWRGEAPDLAGASAGLGPSFCDGVVALVLSLADVNDTRVRIVDFGNSARPYSPQDERLDPAPWVAEAIADCKDPVKAQTTRLAMVEAAGPTAICEWRVLTALADRASAGTDIDQWNGSGGGASAWFGPATGLRQFEALANGLGTGQPRSGAMVDLAGPLGQHVTFLLLTRGGDQ